LGITVAAGLKVSISGTHLLVLLEKGAVPFCAYDNARFGSEPEWMPVNLLQTIVREARKLQTALTLVFGKKRPPVPIEKLVESTEHAKIVPLALEKTYPDAVLVLEADEVTSFTALNGSFDRNIILRLTRTNLSSCAALFEALAGKFRRLSIQLVGVEYFTQADFAVYERALQMMADSLGAFYREGQAVELNVLSDRMMLMGMRNCDAGVKHFTIAPNGKTYICPAFYYDDEDSFIGDVKKGSAAKPVAGVEFRRAPLCSRCDAFHCKRCVYLNQKTTLELNVPSEQQCAVAHMEREASRRLMNELRSIEPFRTIPLIPELNYCDPLELIDLPPRGVYDPSSDPML